MIDGPLNALRPLRPTYGRLGAGLAALVITMAGLPPAAAAAAVAAEIRCGNPGNQVFNKAPAFKAPDGTRGVGLSVWVDGKLTAVPDARAECLPISVRYNNLGALKTPSAGPWPGQTGKDAHGHAIFATVEDGIAAWGTWITRRAGDKPTSALALMSIYAPPDDCVGSVGTPPNCPYGINPTREYAARIAAALKVRPDEAFTLVSTDCRFGRPAMRAFFLEIVRFEAGGQFCGGKACAVDEGLFDDAVDRVSGPVNPGPCADPAGAHEE